MNSSFAVADGKPLSLPIEFSNPVNLFGIRRCGCDSIFVPILEIRRSVSCHPVIPAFAAESMVRFSVVVDRSTLSSSDPNVSDVRPSKFSCHAYLRGWIYALAVCCCGRTIAFSFRSQSGPPSDMYDPAEGLAF